MRSILFIFLVAAAKSIAVPQELVIVNGDVEITSTAESLVISASDQAVLSWNDFSIGPNEKVEFIQPSIDAVAINRVREVNPSHILGRLSGNGKLILVNPSGIFVGKEAIIDTGSWIASTLDLNLEVFAKTGEWEFEGESKSPLVNEGVISSKRGDLFLIGKEVQNKGSLVAVGDSIGVIASQSVRLRKGGLYVLGDRALNDSQNPYANSFSVVDGSISNPGGKIYVLGDTVGIGSSALIEVSHEHRPGEIFIGGDFQGKNGDLLNAQWTFVQQGAMIRSDALLDGDGGKIIIWADRDTVFQGGISARGLQNGGFAEVSGKRALHYEGISYLEGQQGNTGTLLLDPTQITIGGATANVALGNCGFPGNTYASTVAAGTLSAATLVAQLGAASTVITTSDGTCGPFAGTGDILVTSAVSWATANSLTLNAARDITVTANIQNTFVSGVAGPNRVILNAARNITINNAAVGSRDGGTSVVCVGDLRIGTAFGQIGFNNAVSCFGSIAVSCNHLTMQSLTGSTQIGHGRLNAAAAGLVTNNCNISVTATGNIAMSNGAGVNQHSKIGHGTAQMGAGNNQSGNITIFSGGSLIQTTVASVAGSTTIGHGPGFSNGGPLTLAGNIDIQLANDLIMNGTNSQTAIGHGSLFTLAQFSLVSGDINLCCGQNATLTGNAFITHRSGGNADMPGDTINANYNISIGQNLSISNSSASGTGVCSIGFVSNQIQQLNGTFNLAVCGNTTISTPILGSSIRIGYMSQNTTSTTIANIAIGGNFTGTNLTTNLRIASEGNLNLAVRDNLGISMGAGNFDGFLSSGTTGTTRVYTGGFLNVASNGTSVFSIGIPPFAPMTTTGNLDIRAGGNIQWANNYSTSLTGSINIQSGYSFASGELWSGNGTQLTSISNQTLSPALNLSCGLCGTFVSASSSIISTCGAFSVQGAGGPAQPIDFTTGAGQPLTLTSLCVACGGAASSIAIGTGAGNNIHFGGAPGNVGSLNLGAFDAINLNQNITSTGTITIRSCHNLNLNPGFSIVSTGGGSPITLIADVDNSGAGNLNLNGGNITSNNGPICLLAAPGTFGCSSNNCLFGAQGLVMGASSSINHTSGQINSGSASTILVASGNISIDGSAVSISTTSGSIALTSGMNLTIDEDLFSISGTIATFSGGNTNLNSAALTTSNEIRMIAGDQMSLSGSTMILSSSNSVTLVVDSFFSSPPLIGTGALIMGSNATISSGLGQPLRIFTALQGLNSIGGTLNGTSFSPGILFQNTLQEIWCTYFECPSPYPFPSLGFPYTIFYKDCLQQVTQQAMVLVDELLVNFHPYNEFPGWTDRFWILYAARVERQPSEPYLIRRRNLNVLNQPKSYTVIMPE